MEKENKKEEKLEAKKQEEIQEFVEEVTESDSVEEIDAFEREREYDESAAERISTDKKVFPTRFSVQRYQRGEYWNYKVSWVKKINGVRTPFELFLTPTGKGKLHYNIINNMYGDKGRLPLEVLRTTTNFNNKKDTKYTLQVSCIQNGRKMIFPWKVASSGDNYILDEFIAVLRDLGEVDNDRPSGDK